MTRDSLKNTFHILIFLIFNSFLSQEIPKELIKENLETKKDSILLQKEQLEDIVYSKADNIRNDIPKKMSFLNKNAQIRYQDIEINADYISIDWDTGSIFARGEINEQQRITIPAIVTQTGKKYEYDQVSFNLKNRQAIAYNVRTEEGEGIIVSKKSKKINDSIYYMSGGKYTTDEMFISKKDTIADYYLLTPTIKLIKKKGKSTIITGPIQMYIEGVPTPFVLPFAVLPFSEKRTKGILIPSFGERQDVGFFLNGLGYYYPIGKYLDFKVLIDFYTKGSWSIRPEITYKKKYRYSGTFMADLGTTVMGIKGLDNYNKQNTYRITWRHQQDLKANPLFQFSSSVDLTSSRFFNNTINNNYILNQDVLRAQQNSSINITKRFLDLPFTLSANASYSQNFTTGLSDFRLPMFTVNMNQFYLFKPKNGIRKGVLENITVNTNLDFSNYISTKDTSLFTSKIWDDMKTGTKNTISLGTTTTVLRYFNFTMGANINNVGVLKTIRKHYDPTTNTVVSVSKKGIAGFSSFSTSFSLQTTLYGMLKFGRNSKVQTIRHMLIPSMGFSYTPDFSSDFWGYYRGYYDVSGQYIRYSIFKGSVYGSPSSTLSKSINFNFNNNIEIKVRSKEDSLGIKKIKIFENLRINFSYNAAAEKFKWSPININAQNGFFENKLNINYNVIIDPYKVIYKEMKDRGIRLNKLGSFNINNFNLGVNFSLSEHFFNTNKEEQNKPIYKKRGEIMYEPYYFDENNYARFNQPWSLSIGVTYSYHSNLVRPGSSSASISLNGNWKLTPYWNINGSTHYDIIDQSFQYMRLGFSRDQRSFTINFNWTPVGQFKVYDFFIGIKANILRDAVKYRSRSFPRSSRNSF